MGEGAERLARRMRGNAALCACWKAQPTKSLLLGGEGAERSEADEGERSFLHIESAANKRLPLGGEAVRLVLTDEV